MSGKKCAPLLSVKICQVILYDMAQWKACFKYLG